MHLSVFNPASPQSLELLRLWNACAWICGLVLTVVTVAILYILYRYRRRGDTDPRQTEGSRGLEIFWTAVPLALVSFLFVRSILTARAVDRPVLRGPDIVVSGHQWWWEVQYPGRGQDGSDVITANEIHLPAGRDMLIGIEAADVIHDFWVPELGRKIDAIPGRRLFLWIRADRAGTYLGACAEYCGTQHAWMRFRVIAQEPAQYQEWLSAQAGPAVRPAAGDANRGETRFGQLTCANCHNIRGVNTQKQYAPDLTHFASRQMLAADRVENTPQNLTRWLRRPDVFKPESHMPNLNLSDQDLRDLSAYLGSLK